MFKMFAQIFAAITVLFQAVEKGANAINHLAGWGEETAGAFADEARLERQMKAEKMAQAIDKQKTKKD